MLEQHSLIRAMHLSIFWSAAGSLVFSIMTGQNLGPRKGPTLFFGQELSANPDLDQTIKTLIQAASLSLNPIQREFIGHFLTSQLHARLPVTIGLELRILIGKDNPS
jgi:hypothetical protein